MPHRRRQQMLCSFEIKRCCLLVQQYNCSTICIKKILCFLDLRASTIHRTLFITMHYSPMRICMVFLEDGKKLTSLQLSKEKPGNSYDTYFAIYLRDCGEMNNTSSRPIRPADEIYSIKHLISTASQLRGKLVFSHLAQMVPARPLDTPVIVSCRFFILNMGLTLSLDVRDCQVNSNHI